jgi:hypothetical protein
VVSFELVPCNVWHGNQCCRWWEVSKLYLAMCHTRCAILRVCCMPRRGDELLVMCAPGWLCSGICKRSSVAAFCSRC